MPSGAVQQRIVLHARTDPGTLAGTLCRSGWYVLSRRGRRWVVRHARTRALLVSELMRMGRRGGFRVDHSYRPRG